MDQGAQRKLASLQTLKEILDSGNASENDLIEIRNTIMQKMAEKMAATRQQPSQTPIPPVSMPNAYLPPQPTTAPTPAPNSLFNSTNLAELLRATVGQQAPQQQQPYHYGPPQPDTSPSFPTAENPLLAQLRASGILSAAPTPPQGVTPPLPALGAFATTDNSLEVSFTSASIKIPRPHLVSTLLNSRPNQCSTCGKRFTSDEIGREKKARHLDWHFKTKARMLEAEKRGQNRSWYVDEREWIASKEFEDDVGPTDAKGQPLTAASVAAVKKSQDFVRVPADPLLRSLACPIDQEPFKSEWSEDVQDFIWKDAVQVGSRYYHASCYAEVTKGREKQGVSTPVAGIGRTATPDSVLGKRKAEVS
jgi:pre-mRNA cleavage complex 2 protein Pcf11